MALRMKSTTTAGVMLAIVAAATAGSSLAAERESSATNVPAVRQVVFNNRTAPAAGRGGASISEVEGALSSASEAAEPYQKSGFVVREDYWAGTLAPQSTKAVVHQLFRKNEYWFWVGTSVAGAKISLHIYDAEGNLAESEAWAKPRFAAAHISPKKSGSYYLIVSVEKSDRERIPWALTYGFR